MEAVSAQPERSESSRTPQFRDCSHGHHEGLLARQRWGLGAFLGRVICELIITSVPDDFKAVARDYSSVCFSGAEAPAIAVPLHR